tara:strand:+ start:417 stop:566 length:150 start_codon:yes stop_codon:yes gene_type:complete
MKYFTRKDGSVFGKENPTKEQLEQYKKDGITAVKKGVEKAKKKAVKKVK